MRLSPSSPRRSRIPCLLISLTLTALVSCSDSSSGPLPDAAVPDLARHDGSAADASPGQLPTLPAQSGVAYVVHYHTSDLRWYRLDGAAPAAGGQLDLGEGKVAHDLALDAFHDLLFVVSDEKKEVDIFKLSRPTSPEQSLAPPQRLTTISTGARPLLARLDEQRRRLYVVASPSDTGAVDHYLLQAYDVSDPAQPRAVSGSPFTIPLTISVALDAPRAALFLVESASKKLYGYDLAGDKLQALDGQPLELAALYPEENQFVLQVRSLTADPYHHRLYAARAQGPLSELIVLDYPAALPSSAQSYKQLARLDQIKPLDDPFNVDQPIAQRPTLLDAYAPAVDLERGAIFLSASAHAELSNPAVMVAVSADLKLGTGCGDLGSFGCWYRGHSGGAPLGYLPTDGALCVDWTHRAVVGTSTVAEDETLPGTVQFFHYTDALSMTPWLPASGGDLPAGALPVGAVCH
jgi:hypothetical protein